MSYVLIQIIPLQSILCVKSEGCRYELKLMAEARKWARIEKPLFVWVMINKTFPHNAKNIHNSIDKLRFLISTNQYFVLSSRIPYCSSERMRCCLLIVKEIEKNYTNKQRNSWPAKLSHCVGEKKIIVNYVIAPKSKKLCFSILLH